MGGPEFAHARRAEVVVGDYFQDLGGSQFPHSATAREGEMLVFKPFSDAGRAGITRSGVVVRIVAGVAVGI